jgi:hypothetical protein
METKNECKAKQSDDISLLAVIEKYDSLNYFHLNHIYNKMHMCFI